MAVAAKRKTTEKQFHNEVKFFIKLNLIFCKAQVFWKSHKIWKNMPLFLKWQSGRFFFKFFGTILEYLNFLKSHLHFNALCEAKFLGKNVVKTKFQQNTTSEWIWRGSIVQIYSTPKQSCAYSLSHVDYKLQANVCILAMSITIKGYVWYLLNIFVFFFYMKAG